MILVTPGTVVLLLYGAIMGWMDLVYPQALFSTPGMVSVLVFVVTLEILSLLYLGITVTEFLMLRRRHISFFHAIRKGDQVHTEPKPAVLLWIYILSTACMMVLSILLFLFQPHIF